MAVFFDEESDEDQTLRDILDGSFQGGLSERFRTEYEEGSCLNSWDMLLSPEERERIAALGINPSSKTICPYLQLAPGSTSYFYCQRMADNLVRNTLGQSPPVKFSGKVGKEGGAEAWARCPSDRLSNSCAQHFRKCGIVKSKR